MSQNVPSPLPTPFPPHAHCIMQAIVQVKCSTLIHQLAHATDGLTTPYPTNSTYHTSPKDFKGKIFTATRTYISNLASDKTGKTIDPADTIEFWEDDNQNDENKKPLGPNTCRINAMSAFGRDTT